jgi:hypothetical protein
MTLILKMEKEWRSEDREMGQSRDGGIGPKSSVCDMGLPTLEEAYETDAGPAETYFPGMVNLSGTLCYMNSVLQVYLPSLHACQYQY